MVARWHAVLAVWTLLIVLLGGNRLGAEQPAGLQAGAVAVDITPRQWPVRVNGGFLEASADRAEDLLHARCLVLAQGDQRVALLVVDSCMIPRDVCDDAKSRIARATGIPRDRILVAATHTHSAPSVMDYCLGSRDDPQYTPYLVARMVESVEQAVGRLEPAEAAWGAVDAGELTNCRRWLTRADQRLTDPFGRDSVRANMHPGHEHPHFAGPSGPTDPALSFLSVRTRAGKPLALLGNFSMHYFGGHDGLSADYCGAFARQVQERLASGDQHFVGMLSQGTSGDLWWGDYSRPKQDRQMEEYTAELVAKLAAAWPRLQYRADVPLAMAERRMALGRRTPDAERLAWARGVLAAMGDRLPANLLEVYARQAVFLHEYPTTEVVLQALRVGELGITAMPNEVYALTGLKLKLQSPLAVTMNVELANGAAGYIPPPEQHRLGGYTTWPATTAGLEERAEPIIAAQVLALLEEVAQRPRRVYREPDGAYAKKVLDDQPYAYYRMAEWAGEWALDASGNERPARRIGDFAFFLPGPPGAAFAGAEVNRAVHSVEGHLELPGPSASSDGSVEFWFWNGLTLDARPVTATLARWGQQSVTLTGSEDAQPGRLAAGSARGAHAVPRFTWAHVVLVRDKGRMRVYLNGEQELEFDVATQADAAAPPTQVTVGGFPGDTHALHGRIDEVAVYDRPLSPSQIARHYEARR